MYLQKLKIFGFRRFENLTVNFKRGLNVIVGPNNGGKTAVVDAIRVLLSISEESSLRLTELDLHQASNGDRATEAKFVFVFRGLTRRQEAEFVNALRPVQRNDRSKKTYEAVITIQYSVVEPGGRLRVKRWVGDHDENQLTSEMLEELRSVYLQPLRDPASGLRPGRSSQLSKLLHRLSETEQREQLREVLKSFDRELMPKPPLSTANRVIADKHRSMLGKELAQLLNLELSPSDFARFAARIGLSIGGMEVEQNGLGFNNLIYMAVVLSELSLNGAASYCALIVEEPEAHLHPQLQAVLLDYLKKAEHPEKGQRAVQVFVTSHSPNFAALADLDSISCVYDGPEGPAVFSPRSAKFEPGKKEKLQRYLNVTRAELFFARRLILVEGTAEIFIIEALAEKIGYDLRKSSVSVISTDGLNFDCFLPLFGEGAMQIPVAVISDADPPADVYPKKGGEVSLSAVGRALQRAQDSYVKCFFALKTLEYDLALERSCRDLMLAALTDMHPLVGARLRKLVNDPRQTSAMHRARALFKGMFGSESTSKGIQKGRFAQLLAFHMASSKARVVAPAYIDNAMNFVVSRG